MDGYIIINQKCPKLNTLSFLFNGALVWYQNITVEKTCDLVTKNKASDSFTKYVTTHFATEAKITMKYVRERIQVEVL